MDGQFPNSPFFDQLPEDFRKFFEQPERREPPPRPRSREPIFDGQGSGLVYREDGIIMTNRHVIEGANKVKIVFKDGREFDGEVLGVDRESDIGVVKIDATGLTPAKLGDSSKTKAGEFAIAIGSPFELNYSVTVGHVSAKGRRVFSDQFMFDQDFIQTDASINPGNSGGPLVNIYGEVIGINTLIRGMNTGIGFAVPVNLAKRVADMLIKDGKVTRAWLGVSITTLREDTDLRDLAKGVEDGVVVRQFVPGGPAENSQLQLADIITSIDGTQVKSAEELKRSLRYKNAGDTVNAPLTPQGGEDDVSKLGKKKFMVSDKQTKMNPDDDVESTQAPTLTAKDLEFIAKFSQHSGADIVRTFVHSLCPQIFGHDVVKLGLLLCLFGGVRKSIAGCGKVPTRGSLHCLIVGDPGLGKSQMLKAVSNLAPRSIYVCGRTVSAAEEAE